MDGYTVTVIVVILLILLAALAYYYFTLMEDEPSLGPSPGPSVQEPETIVIGGGEQTSGSEGYVMSANENVPLDVSPYNLYAYNPNSTSDPNFGGADIFNEDEGTCPDGTRGCLYFERVTDGRVTDITDKDGNQLIQQFVDDFYDGKLPLLDQMLEDKPQVLEQNKLSEDNKLMKLKDGSWVKINPGTDMPVGQYLTIVMVLYKATGKPKPNVVIDLPAVERSGPAPNETD
jgi:hypothetical protein